MLIAFFQKTLKLTNNYFNSNEAITEGGAIKWIEVEPIIDYSNNLFLNNSAQYGPINAGFPFRIEMGYSDIQTTICRNESGSCYKQLPDLSSGAVLNISLLFSIKDIYNNTVSSVNSG